MIFFETPVRLSQFPTGHLGLLTCGIVLKSFLSSYQAPARLTRSCLCEDNFKTTRKLHWRQILLSKMGRKAKARQETPSPPRWLSETSSPRKRTWRSAKGIAFCLSVAGLIWGGNNWYKDHAIGFSHHLDPLTNWEDRRAAVKDAFVSSWDAYSRDAWGEFKAPSDHVFAASLGN